MTFEIEKNVAIPERKKQGSIYPFEVMQIGDSFFVPIKPDGKQNVGVKTRMSQLNKQYKGMQHWLVRVVDGGQRVWRDK